MHVLIIHDDDQDGCCAAVIAKKYYAATKDTVIDLAVDTDEIDWDNCDADTVVFLDHTPSISRVDALTSEGKLVWVLDHHPETAEQIKSKSDNLNVDYREDWATAKIAWNHYFPDKKVPFTVTMINKWDSWNHDEENILPFHYGLASMDLSDERLWDALLFADNDQAAIQITQMGNALGQFWLATINELTDSTAWVVEKEGIRYSVCNSQLTSSYDLMSHIKRNDCQGAVWFYNENNGTEKTWKVVIKVLPDTDRKSVSRKELLTYDQLKDSWINKESK